jgi:hypothetical protein
MLKIKLDLSCDFSEPAFEDAVGRLETTPDKVQILCAADNAVLVHSLVKRYGCEAVLLPPELLSTPYHWAVRNSSATVWSSGV